MRSLRLIATELLLLTSSVFGYIPAIAVNAAQGGLDVSDNSTVYLTWNPKGTYSTLISYQQAGRDSVGISKGALVRVNEEDLWNNDTTDTPWIALISCDRNASNMSLENDIFTLVRDRGAVAALLYSNVSDGCLVNPFYLSDEFDQIFDIFTAKKPSTAILIQSQFTNINYSYTTFNAQLLNQSRDSVRLSLPRVAENKSPYLIANLRAANATEEGEDDPAPVPTSTASPPNHDDPNSGLAMIVLYVIVGLVATLFIIVIISGAIRAFRYPERYGPRVYDPTIDGPDGHGQTRAAGITRAILDTFPVVKFGRTPTAYGGHYPIADDSTDRGSRYAMKEWELERAHPAPSTADTASRIERSYTNRSSVEASHTHYGNSHLSKPTSITGNTHPSSPRASDDATSVDPAAIGRETCPICIVDFEEGDDLRVLPCEGKHRFHKDCVDPWLLELSTSCPICREDFQALENIAAAGQEEEDIASELPPSTPKSRFAKYIRFAQRRRSQRQQTTAPVSSTE